MPRRTALPQGGLYFTTVLLLMSVSFHGPAQHGRKHHLTTGSDAERSEIVQRLTQSTAPCARAGSARERDSAVTESETGTWVHTLTVAADAKYRAVRESVEGGEGGGGVLPRPLQKPA